PYGPSSIEFAFLEDVLPHRSGALLRLRWKRSRVRGPLDTPADPLVRKRSVRDERGARDVHGRAGARLMAPGKVRRPMGESFRPLRVARDRLGSLRAGSARDSFVRPSRVPMGL